MTLRWNFQHSTQLCTPFKKSNQHPYLPWFEVMAAFPHSTPTTLPLWQPKFIGFFYCQFVKTFETPKNFNQKY
jgi:hypothetical protein